MAIGRIPEPLAGIQEAILDAKGDLISATAADTPARLAVGSNNQILMADSAQSTGLKWAASATSTLTAKGDLLTATAANTIARLGVGADGTTLVADSSTATGLKWATASGGGKVLQVVFGSTTTEANTTSTTFSDSNLTASITPSSTSSKVLVLVTQDFNHAKDAGGNGDIKLVRGSTDLASLLGIGYTENANYFHAIAAMNYLDSPSTTSSTTYKTQFRSRTSGVNFTVQSISSYSSIILLEIGA